MIPRHLETARRISLSVMIRRSIRRSTPSAGHGTGRTGGYYQVAGSRLTGEWVAFVPSSCARATASTRATLCRPTSTTSTAGWAAPRVCADNKHVLHQGSVGFHLLLQYDHYTSAALAALASTRSNRMCYKSAAAHCYVSLLLSTMKFAALVAVAVSASSAFGYTIHFQNNCPFSMFEARALDSC